VTTDRESALAVYRDRGLATAARETGVPKSTLRRWAQAAGMDTARLSAHTRSQTMAAVEQHRLTMAERRIAMAEALMTEAEVELTRLRQAKAERKLSASGKEVTWELAEPEPGDRRNIATTVAILLDKSNLLSGEVTSRTESLTAEQARERVAEILQLRVVDGGSGS
jgi:hypothetical protein